MTPVDTIRGNLGYVSGVRRFLRQIDRQRPAGEELRARLARREESFLELLGLTIYANPQHPYRRLLDHARIVLGDVETMVRREGLEAALETLYDAGVYITQDESKGKKPITRPGIEFTAAPSDFNNPLTRASYSGSTSGSTGPRRRVLVDLESVIEEVPYFRTAAVAHGVAGRPVGVWRPAPPDANGLTTIFRHTAVGQTPRHWFSQTRFFFDREGFRAAIFQTATLLTARLARHPLPAPEFVPRDQALRVAQWLASEAANGTPGFLDASASSAVRICLAARQAGLDLSGSAFRLGGEPYTPAKAAILSAVGARGVVTYAMGETGIIGFACGSPQALDDMHLLSDKVAMIQKQVTVAADGSTVGALAFTSLTKSCRTIMLNAISGDYAQVESRDCGCPFGDLGFSTHISSIFSYDKLVSEGATFLGSVLYDLVEQELPARFGGNPSDYQIVEREDEDGLNHVYIVIAPRVGEVDEAGVIAAVLDSLGPSTPGGRLMADQWRQASALKVWRHEPFVSGSRKVLPLYVLRDGAATPPS